MLTTLYRSAFAWTIVGLVGGLGYRELTRSQGFTGRTQLAFVHTHALALGATFLLLLLALAVTLRLGDIPRFRVGVHTWNAGLAVTTTMLAVKGTLQILDPAIADSKALAGVSGLGHITLAVAFVLVLLAIGKGVKAVTAREAEAVPNPGDAAPARLGA